MAKSEYQIEIFRFCRGLCMWSFVFALIGSMLIYVNYEILDSLRLSLVIVLELIVLISLVFSARYYLKHRKEFADDEKDEKKVDNQTQG